MALSQRVVFLMSRRRHRPGIHIGNPQTANLGDGHGAQNEIKVIRQDFGNPNVGTCLETAIGGDHFRYWRQNGPSADSGALFLACAFLRVVPGKTNSHFWVQGIP